MPFNLKRSRITRGIDELLVKGFIRIVHQGGAFDKDKSEYAIVDDFLKWRPGDPPIRKRKADHRRGYQGKKLGVAKKTTHADVTH